MAVTTIRDARRAQCEADPRLVPAGHARSQAFRSSMRVERSTSGGKARATFDGYASVFERSYTMWDFWGEYNEVVSIGAADETLAASPDVAFLTNHRGITMARTSNGTLELSADATGLRDVATCNAERSDVNDIALAVDDGDVNEQSFAFTITRGQWSPDYTEYRIDAFDLDRGDVSVVNFGANPYTSVTARSGEIMAALDFLPPGAARAAIERLQARAGIGLLDVERAVRRDPAASVAAALGVQRTGRGVSQLAAMLELDR